MGVTYDRDPFLRFLRWVRLGDGCWEWTGDKIQKGTAQGYGRFWFEGKTRRAHKWSYEWFFGAVPEGLVVHHTCENKGCVNPKHLRATTTVDNLMASDTPARRNAQKTHCPQGHPLSGDNLMRSSGRRYCRICHRAATKRSTARRR
jgi:hypothetical protein